MIILTGLVLVWVGFVNAIAQRDKMRMLDTKMDQVQGQMLGWKAVNWSPRRYVESKGEVTQAWVVEPGVVGDGNLKNQILAVRSDAVISISEQNGVRVVRVTIYKN
jgi:hypothetical protein